MSERYEAVHRYLGDLRDRISSLHQDADAEMCVPRFSRARSEREHASSARILAMKAEAELRGAENVLDLIRTGERA